MINTLSLLLIATLIILCVSVCMTELVMFSGSISSSEVILTLEPQNKAQVTCMSIESDVCHYFTIIYHIPIVAQQAISQLMWHCMCNASGGGACYGA